MNWLKQILILSFLYSCTSQKNIAFNKEALVEKRGTILSIQGDLYFVDTLFKSDVQLSQFLNSGSIILDKIVFMHDRPMKMLYRGRMLSFMNKYYECGLLDSLHEVKYISARPVFKNMSPTSSPDAQQKMNELCIHSLANSNSAYYWKFRNNVKYVLTDVLPLCAFDGN